MLRISSLMRTSWDPNDECSYQEALSDGMKGKSIMNMLAISEVFQGPQEITDQWCEAFRHYAPSHLGQLRLNEWLI